MQLQGPTAASLMFSDTGGGGPVVVLLLYGVLMGGTLWDTVVERLRDRYRCIVPELPFGVHTTPMPDDPGVGQAAVRLRDAGLCWFVHRVHRPGAVAAAGDGAAVCGDSPGGLGPLHRRGCLLVQGSWSVAWRAIAAAAPGHRQDHLPPPP